jgi:hypothetical protein
MPIGWLMIALCLTSAGTISSATLMANSDLFSEFHQSPEACRHMGMGGVSMMLELIGGMGRMEVAVVHGLMIWGYRLAECRGRDARHRSA